MDYNYVRMRNARKAGDHALEEHYKRLLERGVKSMNDSRALTYAIILLAAVAVILGIYIVYTEVSGGTADPAQTVAGIFESFGGVIV